MTGRDTPGKQAGRPCPSCGKPMVFRVTYFNREGVVTNDVCMDHDLLLIDGIGVITLANPNAVRVEK